MFRQVDSGLSRRITAANRLAAREALKLVKAAASTRHELRIAQVLRISATQRGAGIVMDDQKEPSIFGGEFGGGKYGKDNPTPGTRTGTGKRGGYTTQFRPHLGKRGYFIWPTVREFADGPAQEMFVDALLGELAKGPVQRTRRKH